MAQSETEIAPAVPEARKIRRPGVPTWREAAIIIGGTGVVGMLLGLIPHFAS